MCAGVKKFSDVEYTLNKIISGARKCASKQAASVGGDVSSKACVENALVREELRKAIESDRDLRSSIVWRIERELLSDSYGHESVVTENSVAELVKDLKQMGMYCKSLEQAVRVLGDLDCFAARQVITYLEQMDFDPKMPLHKSDWEQGIQTAVWTGYVGLISDDDRSFLDDANVSGRIVDVLVDDLAMSGRCSVSDLLDPSRCEEYESARLLGALHLVCICGMQSPIRPGFPRDIEQFIRCYVSILIWSCYHHRIRTLSSNKTSSEVAELSKKNEELKSDLKAAASKEEALRKELSEKSESVDKRIATAVAPLQQQLRKKDAELEELRREVESLRASQLCRELLDAEDNEEDGEAVDLLDLPTEGVTFVGGFPQIVTRLKSLFPDWTFVTGKSVRQVPASSGIIFIHCESVSHKIVSRMIASSSCPLLYSRGINIDTLLTCMRKMYTAYLNGGKFGTYGG